jgi:seryl-tRNA synthetase
MSNHIAVEKDATKRMQMIEEMKTLKEDLKVREEDLKNIVQEWQTLMLKIPNLPSLDTPEGTDESGNKVIRSWGEKPQFSFTPKEHYEIGENLEIIDTKTAA